MNDAKYMVDLMQYYIDVIKSNMPYMDRESEVFVDGMQYITDLMREQAEMINLDSGIIQ